LKSRYPPLSRPVRKPLRRSPKVEKAFLFVARLFTWICLKGEIMMGPLKGSLETILVVDDSETVRKVVVALLERANFKVLAADSGASALKLARETNRTIDMLLSDVDMPNMSGPDLGQILKKARPEMHVMLMSGGTDGNLLVLNYGWAFIQKPFVAAKLVQMVTEVLRTANRSQPGGQSFDKRKDSQDPDDDTGTEADDHLPDSNES
jgi:DNA-binding NtrC family response regulator